MELKRHLDPKVIFIGLYVILFAVYIIVGLQPAGAAEYNISTQLSIPAIGLSSDVTELTLDEGKLNTPDAIVGSYTRAENKTLLIGHSTTAFQNLAEAEKYDLVDYNGKTYQIKSIETVAKDEIDMKQLLAGAKKDTLVMMTCAGELLDGGDATHRLIITATR